MNGVLVADKPLGPTSHDVVARVRQTLGLRRIGHTGTLDPLATGVLPLVVGQATRLASLLSASVKEYAADIRFGASIPQRRRDGRADRARTTSAGAPGLDP
jgi:tRNA pseudouridine55 synthase